jgi:predicted dehydrogenase
MIARQLNTHFFPVLLSLLGFAMAQAKATRRKFLKTTGVAAVAAPYVITSSALGDENRPPASDRIVMGGIGIGNMGTGDQGAFLARGDVQYVAASDVRREMRERAQHAANQKYGNKDCQIYVDFRELLSREDIDAVHIATPDHWHAIMVIEACQAGKDVYCQKPETLTLREGPLMVAAARRYGRVVSGGSQRVLEDYRQIVDPCWSGELGELQSINVEVGPLSTVCNLPAEDVPDSMDWDRWLGPAPWAPYNSKRCDGNFGTQGNSWRSYIDYSGGGMTDWGAHHFGGATFALDVRELQPQEITLHNDDGVKWVSLKYANGRELTHNRPGYGNLEVVGTAGRLKRAQNATIENQTDDRREPKPVPGYKGSGGIYGDFIECVKTRQQPFRDLQLAVNSVAVSHLATIAYNVDRSLKWDVEKQRFLDDEEANRFLDRARREPWAI